MGSQTGIPSSCLDKEAAAILYMWPRSSPLKVIDTSAPFSLHRKYPRPPFSRLTPLFSDGHPVPDLPHGIDFPVSRILQTETISGDKLVVKVSNRFQPVSLHPCQTFDCIRQTNAS